jgi:hypothetical protein
MAVEPIKAWQISTGQTFAKKQQACHEEMVYLMTTREASTKKGFDLASFDSSIEAQEVLVRKLSDMVRNLDDKQDKEILTELNVLLVDADKWLTAAKELRKDMDN